MICTPYGVADSPGKCYDLGPATREPPVPIESPYYSIANLNDVSTVWVFRDKDTRYLRGLVFEYSNGGERAVGTCRTGLDPVERCTDPSRLRFASFQVPVSPGMSPPPVRGRPLNVVQVKQGDGLEAGWTVCPERGWIETWFNHHELLIILTHDGDMSEEVLGACPPSPPWEGLGYPDSWSARMFE